MFDYEYFMDILCDEESINSRFITVLQASGSSEPFNIGNLSGDHYSSSLKNPGRLFLLLHINYNTKKEI